MSTSAKTLRPCLWFDNQAEAAARFYGKTFAKSRITATSRYSDTEDNPSDKPRGSVMAVDIVIAGQPFTFINGGPMFRVNPSISFFVHVDDAATADRLFADLGDGGKVMMPIDRYPWSERYGWVEDRFGVSWQVMAGPRPASGATIVPCLMFAGRVHGRAEEAMRAYAAVFPDSRVDDISRYEPGEGPVGTVKHGRFRLAGQDLVAMDSHVSHDVEFTEGVSLMVMCRNQAEVDRAWDGLIAGGTPAPCGWLKDRFGLSWQVTPDRVGAWMTSPDGAARDRAFAAMMPPKKPDIAAIEAAFAGETSTPRKARRPKAAGRKAGGRKTAARRKPAPRRKTSARAKPGPRKPKKARATTRRRSRGSAR